MGNLVIPVTAALAVVAVLVAALAVLGLWFLARRRRASAPSLPALPPPATPEALELNRLRRELEALKAQVMQMQGQGVRLRQQVEELRQGQNLSPYAQAIQLAQQGLSPAEVAASCGISRGEAELVVALYRGSL